MIYWAPFLHFYQPPTQQHAVLKKIGNESYRPLFKMLSEHPNSKLTINICAVLTEALSEHGASDILADIKRLAAKGQIEFVDSAAYHAILPLIPKEEMARQVELNNRINSKFFEDTYKIRGFFPPEMCYSSEVGSFLSSIGYEWVILSGIACSQSWPLDEIYNASFPKSTLSVFYRDDIISNRISFRAVDSATFLQDLAGLARGRKDIYVITAMDAETFGHHIKNWEKIFLGQAFDLVSQSKRSAGLVHKRRISKEDKELQAQEKPQFCVVTISELLKKFPKRLAKPPKPSSWSTTKDEITNKIYYPLWKHPKNRIHSLQWEHLNMVFDLTAEAFNIKDNNQETARYYSICREILDKALHSCQFWWANKGRMWDINMVNKGLMLQEEAILNAQKAIAVSEIGEEVETEFYHKVAAARDVANKIRDQLLST